MKSLIADANLFLRFLLNDIPAQFNIAKKLFLQAKKDKVKIIVPQIIIFEIEYALSKYYKFPKNEIIDKLDSIVSASYFSIQDGDIFKQAIKIYKEKNLSLVDCFLIAKSEITGVDIFTFDKKEIKI